MFELVDLPPAVVDPPDPRPLPDAFTLTFDAVGFSYPGQVVPAGTPIPRSAGVLTRPGLRARTPALRKLTYPVVRETEVQEATPALDGVSFALGAAGRLAIVGGSGSGKSTVARLVLCLYDPTRGVIRLGDRDLSSYRLDDLRGAMALVPQSPYLFSDTLRRNLQFGRPDATEEELQDAISAAQLDAVIAHMPLGLETPLGENGVALSGGERQRVAIARALLMRPRLLILDEATANLDPLTERAILHAVMARMAGRALLVISHRLVEMETMDEILVLDGGRVVERGTYDTLARSGGCFADLLAAQNEMLDAPMQHEDIAPRRAVLAWKG
jgi:ABC-type multidrug transport system fused ATPase/permease subunit